MIFSMTGYASATRDLGRSVISMELRSVNSRYLDPVFRVAEELRVIEPQLRELVTARVTRGKIECRVGVQAGHGLSKGLAPNPDMLRQLRQWQQAVLDALPGAQPLSVAEVLDWPGVFAEACGEQDTLSEQCLQLAAPLLEDFIATRAREGAKLEAMLRERLAMMNELTARVAPRMPAAVTEYQDKLAARLREVLAAADEERVRQEVAVFAARIDVAEELTRLCAHLSEAERVLDKGGVVGKRLDFIMQELNREANTLASKSMSADITATAVEMKLLIEQMREQVQNLE